MIRRLVVIIPVLGIFLATSVIFLAARAPQTWAPNWSGPTLIAGGSGESEYGAAPRTRRGWDLLWVDADVQSVMLTRYGANPLPLDHGDVSQPSLLREGRHDLGVWIHNRNGSTDLMLADTGPGRVAHVRRLISGAQPIEHPYLFAGRDRANLVFSWQKYGNFDVYWLPLGPGGQPLAPPRRLTVSASYAFYPRAVGTADGGIALLHLESCCDAQGWKVEYDRFNRFGRHLGRTKTLTEIDDLPSTDIPSQWAEDLQVAAGGAIWGAFAGPTGAYVFEAGRTGQIQRGPVLMDRSDNAPESLAIVPRDGGYLFWPESYDLGTYLVSVHFTRGLRLLGVPQRVVYESAAQTNPHAAVVGGKVTVMWQAIGGGLRSRFEDSSYRRAGQPDLAQRLGLGLGNPWEEAAILAVSAIGVATVTTVGNILTIFAFALAGLLVLRLLRPVPGRWVIYAALLSTSLFLTFVDPGGPILFLSTLPAMGLSAEPFGIVASLGALAFTGWTGLVALRRMEEPFRAGLMVVLGVYFFAFLEAMIFVQQRLGYI